MNILNDLRELRTTSEKPEIKVFLKTNDVKIIAIALAKGVELKEHKTLLFSRLLVLEGEVIYKETNQTKTLTPFEELEIPVNEIHALYASKNSLCFLIQQL